MISTYCTLIPEPVSNRCYHRTISDVSTFAVSTVLSRGHTQTARIYNTPDRSPDNETPRCCKLRIELAVRSLKQFSGTLHMQTLYPPRSEPSQESQGLFTLVDYAFHSNSSRLAELAVREAFEAIPTRWCASLARFIGTCVILLGDDYRGRTLCHCRRGVEDEVVAQTAQGIPTQL
jgi:hypothetical protein